MEALCGEGALATEHIRLHRRLNPRAAEPQFIENVLTIAAFVSRDYRQVRLRARAAHLAPPLPPLRINWILNLVGAGESSARRLSSAACSNLPRHLLARDWTATPSINVPKTAIGS